MEVTGPRSRRNREETRSPQRGCKMHWKQRASVWSHSVLCPAQPFPSLASATLSRPRFPPLSTTSLARTHLSAFSCLHTPEKSSGSSPARTGPRLAGTALCAWVWAGRGPGDKGPAVILTSPCESPCAPRAPSVPAWCSGAVCLLSIFPRRPWVSRGKKSHEELRTPEGLML